MRYLLDTNICIYLIKNRPPEVLESFRKHSPEDVAISAITLFELEYGVEKSGAPERSKSALAKFLLSLNLIEFDPFAASDAAAIRAKLEKQGTPIGPFDLLIAAIARSRDMILVTNNIREFSRIEGLQTENWVEA